MQAHATDLRSEIDTEWNEITPLRETDADGRDALVRGIVADWRQVDLHPRIAALLGFTDKMTRTPAEHTEGDVNALRSQGWSDQAIHDATQVISYFNYINRVADALGVALEADLPDWES